MKNYFLKDLAKLAFLFSLAFLLSLVIFYRVSRDRVVALTNPQSGSVDVSLSIGEYHFRLFGYTSPYALVKLEGRAIYDETYANSEGYFEFSNRFSPKESQETCLTAQDQLGRISSPVCIPPFPTNRDVVIGPVLMPPTLTMNKSDYFVGDQVVLTGQTIPNTSVKLASFTSDAKRALPGIETPADKDGNYGVQMPSSATKEYRTFTQTKYDGQDSPKSRTLDYSILPIWMIIIRIAQIIFNALKSRMFEYTILFEMGVLLVYFLRRYLRPHVIARNKALALRPEAELVKEETGLALEEPHALLIK